jgi:lipopolysaccharide biosynthesis glycosyltransferase
MNDLKIYIGYDSREDIAYRVAEASIRQYNTNIEILPVIQSDLINQGIYYREPDTLASTEFTITRFLTPYLSDYKGWSLFVDCDIVLLDDIQKLFNLKDDQYAIQVVKHDYAPINHLKMDGKQQTIYPRKNWSSVMLFNNAHPANKELSINFVNSATPSQLHRLTWLSDDLIGDLSVEWNWLAGWYTETTQLKPKLIHYTEGGPWFEEYKDCEYSELWYNIRNSIS